MLRFFLLGNISEELEERLGSLAKLREDKRALLQKICDNYQQIQIFLESTCFEGKDNKLALQQNALHKLQSAEEANFAKDIVSAGLERIIESFGEKVVTFKRELKAEVDVMKQPVPIMDMHHQLHPNQSSHPRMDLTKSTPEQSLNKSSLPISMSEVVDLDGLFDLLFEF